MVRRSQWGLILCAAGAAIPLGCARETPQMSSALFFPAPAMKSSAQAVPEPVTMTADEHVDGPQAVSPTKAVILTSIAPQPLEQVQPLDALPASMKAESSDPVVALQDHPATTTATTAVADSTPTTGASKGMYMTVGGVLAKVNGTPIYTCQVLRRLEKEFSVKARTMNPSEFREFAGEEIVRQMKEIIQDEVIFNQSLNLLDEKDRELCQQIAVHIKQEKITAAGGSLELAKRQAESDGQDFDDQMKQEYREIVHQLVSRRIIEPGVQVTADDMRAYYLRNFSTLYSEESKAKFRVIQIDPAVQKGADPDAVALAKITDIRGRALRGEDFAALASSQNDDDYLRSRAGDPGGWMGQNSYRLEDVEKSVWQLQPGQITPVIKTEGAFYIAKLEEKKIGITRAFDDPIVQQNIYDRIRQQQIAERVHQNEEDSLMDATITVSEDRLDVAVDIAMQQYPIWAAK